jgi:hypothetical protein
MKEDLPVKNIEIKTFYNDPADESNYYLYKYSDSSKPIIKYYSDEDTFYQGNVFLVSHKMTIENRIKSP